MSEEGEMGFCWRGDRKCLVYCFALFLNVCGLRVSGFGWWWCWCVEVSRAVFGGCLGWRMVFFLLWLGGIFGESVLAESLLCC